MADKDTVPVYAHGVTGPGRKRKENEDSFRVERLGPGDVVLVCCDGMGGADAGEVASDIAAEHIVALVRAADPGEILETLRQALISAHGAVRAAGGASPEMGTTAVVARVVGNRLFYGWVGDSRLSVLRQGVVVAGSVDHTQVQEMVTAGLLTAAQARNHPHAHLLTQVIGGRRVEPPRPGVTEIALQPGDAVVVYTDGLHDLVNEAEIAPIIAGRSYRQAAERLHDEANFRGGHDNVTVLVAVPAQPIIAGERVTGRLRTIEDAPAALLPPVPPPAKPPEKTSRQAEKAEKAPLKGAALVSRRLLAGVVVLGIFFLGFLAGILAMLLAPAP